MEGLSVECSLNDAIDYIHEGREGLAIDVTDIDSNYNNVSICTYDLGDETKYTMFYKDVLLISCDRYQLAFIQHSGEEISDPINVVLNSKPRAFTEVIYFGDIAVVKKYEDEIGWIEGEFFEYTPVEFLDSYYTEKVDILFIMLKKCYDPIQLKKVLGKPCRKVVITANSDNIVIRGTAFEHCIASKMTLQNISLSKEARESIEHLDKLELRISDSSTGLSGISANRLKLVPNSDSSLRQRFTVSGNVTNLSIIGYMNIFVRSKTIETIYEEGGSTIFITGCENLHSLTYDGTLVIDTESAQNVNRLNGSLDIHIDFFPRLEYFDGLCLEPTEDISNLIELTFEPHFEASEDMYREQLLNSEKLEKLRVLDADSDEWDSIFKKLLQIGRIKSINLPEGIDIDDYPDVVFIFDGPERRKKEVEEHNKRAMARSKKLMNL